MKHQLDTIRAALEIGRDAAQQVAEHYHVAMAGYAPDHHKALDDDVIRLDKALTALSELEAIAGEQEPILIVQHGEICYKSQDDDQSYGMWCPVTPDAEHGLRNGTQLYAAPPAQQPQAECRHCGGDGKFQMYGPAWECRVCGGTGKQPQAEVGNSGFDHKTAADFLSGKTVSDEAVRKFVQASRWAHDDRASLQSMLHSVRNELASREAEIALLKKELMEAEAAPQQAEAVPSGYVLVPVEPTPAMCDAAVQAICYGPEGGFTRIGGPDRTWSAMIAMAQGEKP